MKSADVSAAEVVADAFDRVGATVPVDEVERLAEEQPAFLYRMIARACHPDRGGDSEVWRAATTAYVALTGGSV